jgi:phosphoribosylanthranilate isomerase
MPSGYWWARSIGPRTSSPPRSRERSPSSAPRTVTPVLVTHRQDPREVAALVATVGVPAVQLHSNCSVETVAALRELLPHVKLLKSFHATGVATLPAMHPFEPIVDGFVLDTASDAEDRVGGTGLTHDWNVSREIVARLSRPVILAGGLDGDNVAEAIRTVGPYGVDANSRLRDAQGFKDPSRVGAFVVRAKREFLRQAQA